MPGVAVPITRVLGIEMYAVPTRGSRKSQRLLVIAAFALVSIVVTIVWVFKCIGLPGRHGDALFRWHPIIMSVGALLLLPIGMFSWSSEESKDLNSKHCIVSDSRQANEESQNLQPRRRCMKLQHVGFVISGFIVMSIGVGVAYASRVQQKLANIYSLHSWVGIAALVAIKINIIMGAIAAVAQCARASLPIDVHRMIGVVAIALSSSAAVLGFAELQTLLVQNKGPWTAAALLAAPLAIMAAVVGLSTAGGIILPVPPQKDDNADNDAEYDKGEGVLLGGGEGGNADEMFGDGLCDMGTQKDMPEILNVDTDTRELSSNSDTSD